MKAIFSLEKRYGIPLLSEISNKQKAFQQEIQMSQREIAKKTKQEGVIPSIDRWLKLACEDVMPTWQNLFLVLHRIDLGDLAWQMVDCILKAMIGMYVSSHCKVNPAGRYTTNCSCTNSYCMYEQQLGL